MTVNEAREILARAFKVPADKVAQRFELDEQAFEAAVRDAIARSLDQQGPFLFHWARVLARREQEREESSGIPAPVRALIRREVTPVANQTNEDLTALGREVSGLNAKVNILMGVAGGSALLIIGGAIALWQAIGDTGHP